MYDKRVDEIVAWLDEAEIKVQRSQFGRITLVDIIAALAEKMRTMEEGLAEIKQARPIQPGRDNGGRLLGRDGDWEKCRAMLNAPTDLKFTVMNIVNAILEEAGTDVVTRQLINDDCDQFVVGILGPLSAGRNLKGAVEVGQRRNDDIAETKGDRGNRTALSPYS